MEICCLFKQVRKMIHLNFNEQKQWNLFYLPSKDQKGKMLAANTLKDESEIALSEPVVTHFK